MNIFFPLEFIGNLITYQVLRLTHGSGIADSVHFFIYDSLKILFLLLVINYVMAIVRYYFPINTLRKVLASRKWYGLEYVLAAFFGVITPFCSCSSIPLFIGFIGAGIPLGVTFAFLITSPLVNEASLALFPALFGWKIALLYNLTGMVVGIIGGMMIQRLNMEKYIEPSFLKFKSQKDMETTKIQKHVSLLLKLWWSEAWNISRSIMPYVLIGVGVGALIHGFLPANFFEHYLVGNSLWTVPVATLIGVPLYANSVSVIPVMEALVEKGIPLGTTLAFMTATVTLSIPEAIILKKVMKWPLLLTFFGITIIGIMMIGYLFNLM